MEQTARSLFSHVHRLASLWCICLHTTSTSPAEQTKEPNELLIGTITCKTWSELLVLSSAGAAFCRRTSMHRGIIYLRLSDERSLRHPTFALHRSYGWGLAWPRRRGISTIACEGGDVNAHWVLGIGPHC